MFSVRNHRFSQGGLVADEFFEWKPLGLGASTPSPRLVAAHRRGGSAVKTMQGWVQQGTKEAIEKRCLKSASLIIIGDCDEAVERYVLSPPL